MCVCKCARINPLSPSYKSDILPLYLPDNLPHECQFLYVQLDNGPTSPNGNEYRMFRSNLSGQISGQERTFICRKSQIAHPIGRNFYLENV